MSSVLHHLVVLLKACLNGARGRAEHSGVPISPEDLARDAVETVVAGAKALHVHPRAEDGTETLHGSIFGRALTVIREAVTVPVGVSTGAWFLPERADRLRAIEGWGVLPDFASVNFHEDGAIEIAQLLLKRGVDVEAGLWHESAAEVFIRSGLGDRCLRILLEPMERSLVAALGNLSAMERRLTGVATEVPRLLHGYERTAWPMLDAAATRGYDARMGFEDTLMGPDGAVAVSNANLVSSALRRSLNAGSSAEEPSPEM